MDENSIVRKQPHNKEAEQSVIGAMLLDREVISEIDGMLTAADFYFPQYGTLYEAMVDLYREGSAVDMITLPEKLRAKGVAEEVAGPATIAEIMQAVPTSVRARDYAKIVQDKSVLRSLIRLCENVEKDSFVASEEVDSILATAEEKLFKLVQTRNGNSDYRPINRIVVDVIDRIEEAARNGGKVNGLPTGFTDLDNLLTGMHGGELLLVAARPAMGKTAFVLNIAHYLAVERNVPCAIFSLEMSDEQLVSRMIAIDAMVDSKKMKLGDMSDDDWDKVIESTEAVSKAPLYIFDNSAVTISEMRSQCRKLKQNQDIKLIILDYLQLMSTTQRVESRQTFIADISRALKNLARELDIPIIALSQLSRAVDSRPDHKPVLSDLRESGAIEQDSDVVMFIYRDEYYNPETTTKPMTAEIIVAKQRNGETASVDLRWLGKYTKFANAEKNYKKE